MTDLVTIQARIRGRVQGVWYRAWTEREANARGLSGWVRNAPDGSVEALFIGPRLAVEDMLAACRSGPPHARVAEIEVRETDAETVTGFSILR